MSASVYLPLMRSPATWHWFPPPCLAMVIVIFWSCRQNRSMQGTFALLPILHPVQFISDSKPDAHLGRFFFPESISLREFF